MKRLAIVLGIALVAIVAWAAMPYVLPTGVALGPCGKDWTSPTSFKPRLSPTESVDIEAGEVGARLCYGSPSVRGREIFGGLVPFGELWRSGANEPTRLFTDGPLSIAGITVPAGRYSLYTIPGAREWQLFISRSTFHWGNDIGEGVRSQEMGAATLTAFTLDTPVESLRFLWEPATGPAGVLVLEWDRTRVEVPVEALR